MKLLTNYHLLLLLVVGCATQAPRQLPETTVPRVEIPTVPVVTTPIRLRGTPSYTLPKDASEDYKQAVELISAYANSDEFYEYVLAKRTYFSHVGSKTVKQCLDEFRDQLDKRDTIAIETYYSRWTKAIGGLWSDGKIHENTKYLMTPTERAGHLLHETSHFYGWIHEGDKIYAWDNTNSFPYAVGYDFEDFLATKVQTLAVKP